MGDTPLKIPQIEVLDTLVKMHAENKEKIGNINGELGQRQRTQQDLNPDYTGFFRKLFYDLTYKFKTNEQGAREMARIGHGAIDEALAYMDRHGHTGDLAQMADRAATPAKNSKTADKPDEQTSDNVVKLKKGIKELKPKEDVKAKADKAEKTSKSKASKAPKDSVEALRDSLKAEKGSFVAEQAEETAKGDAHIKAIAQGQEPPAAPSPEPDQRERAEQPEKAASGRYKIIS